MKFNKLIPELSVSNLEESLAFYIGIIGFKTEYAREKFAFLSFEGSQIMIEETNNVWKTGDLEKPFGRGINFQIEVEDTEPIIKSLKDNNHPLFRDIKDNWYKVGNKLFGNREFLVQDSDGYLLRFFQDIGTKNVD
jgi:catechol 2,3-dioxygenase-like lactoylglutathione lyase family enzyme